MVRAYTCHYDHTIAKIPVRIAGAPDSQTVEFDDDLFRRIQVSVASTTIDLQELHEIYIYGAWSHFVPQKGFSYGGLSAVIGRGYNFSISEVMTDPNLLKKPQKFRRRFFAKIIGSSLRQVLTGILQNQPTTGVSHGSSRRVLISGHAVYIVCTLPLISFCILLAIILWNRPKRWSLGLEREPGTVMGVTLWASGNPDALSVFRPLDLSTRESIKHDLANRFFLTDEEGLREVEQRTEPENRLLDRTQARSDKATSEATAQIPPDLRL